MFRFESSDPSGSVRSGSSSDTGAGPPPVRRGRGTTATSVVEGNSEWYTTLLTRPEVVAGYDMKLDVGSNPQNSIMINQEAGLKRSPHGQCMRLWTEVDYDMHNSEDFTMHMNSLYFGATEKRVKDWLSLPQAFAVIEFPDLPDSVEASEQLFSKMELALQLANKEGYEHCRLLVDKPSNAGSAGTTASTDPAFASSKCAPSMTDINISCNFHIAHTVSEVGNLPIEKISNRANQGRNGEVIYLQPVGVDNLLKLSREERINVRVYRLKQSSIEKDGFLVEGRKSEHKIGLMITKANTAFTGKEDNFNGSTKRVTKTKSEKDTKQNIFKEHDEILGIIKKEEIEQTSKMLTESGRELDPVEDKKDFEELVKVRFEGKSPEERAAAFKALKEGDKVIITRMDSMRRGRKDDEGKIKSPKPSDFELVKLNTREDIATAFTDWASYFGTGQTKKFLESLQVPPHTSLVKTNCRTFELRLTPPAAMQRLTDAVRLAEENLIFYDMGVESIEESERYQGKHCRIRPVASDLNNDKADKECNGLIEGVTSTEDPKAMCERVVYKDDSPDGSTKRSGFEHLKHLKATHSRKGSSGSFSLGMSNFLKCLNPTAGTTGCSHCSYHKAEKTSNDGIKKIVHPAKCSLSLAGRFVTEKKSSDTCSKQDTLADCRGQVADDEESKLCYYDVSDDEIGAALEKVAEKMINVSGQIVTQSGKILSGHPDHMLVMKETGA